jgi:alpha-glucosidase
MLNLYRAAIALRKRTADLVSDEMSWTDSTADVLSFSRGDSTHCIFNFGETPVAIPEGAEVLMASAPLENGALAKDTAVWVKL